MESPDSAKAMLLVEPRHLTCNRLPVKSVINGGWLAIEATGISGADVQTWKGDRLDVVYPLVLGHQVVGRIAATDDADGFEVGTRVVVEPELRCGTCGRCRNGVGGCRNRMPVNSYGRLPSTEPPGLWGGLAEYLYLDPSARLHVVSDDIAGRAGDLRPSARSRLHVGGRIGGPEARREGHGARAGAARTWLVWWRPWRPEPSGSG